MSILILNVDGGACIVSGSSPNCIIIARSMYVCIKDIYISNGAQQNVCLGTRLPY